MTKKYDIEWWLVFMLPLCWMLSGCDTDQPVVITAPAVFNEQRLKDLIPASTLQCLSEPDGSKVKTIRQSATYIVDLRRAGSDCRRKLLTIRDVIAAEK